MQPGNWLVCFLHHSLLFLRFLQPLSTCQAPSSLYKGSSEDGEALQHEEAMELLGMPFKISTSLVWDVTVLTAGMNLRELNLPKKGSMSNV